MTARQRDWPRMWLMTDERMGERLWAAIDRLPVTHSGIIFRHYQTPQEHRAELARRIADICRRKGLTLGIAVDEELAHTLGADLVHNPTQAPVSLPFSRSVHSLEEAEVARADGAALMFVSPIFATRSHPGRPALGPAEAIRIAKTAGIPSIALGGMNGLKFARLHRDGFYGWAAIDAWLTGSQKDW